MMISKANINNRYNNIIQKIGGAIGGEILQMLKLKAIGTEVYDDFGSFIVRIILVGIK